MMKGGLFCNCTEGMYSFNSTRQGSKLIEA
jgi:hypothetical protein